MLAHHFAAALDYAHASGVQETAALAEQGRIALREAGDRAFALNAFAAAASRSQRGQRITSRLRRAR